MVACAYGNPACKHIGIGILALCVSCALLAPCVGAMRPHARHRQSARSGSARTRKRGTPVLVGPFARARAGCRISLPLRRGCVPRGAERPEPFGRFSHKGGALRRFARNVLRAVGSGSAVSEPGGNGVRILRQICSTCGRAHRARQARPVDGYRKPHAFSSRVASCSRSECGAAGHGFCSGRVDVAYGNLVGTVLVLAGEPWWVRASASSNERGRACFGKGSCLCWEKLLPMRSVLAGSSLRDRVRQQRASYGGCSHRR